MEPSRKIVETIFEEKETTTLHQQYSLMTVIPSIAVVTCPPLQKKEQWTSLFREFLKKIADHELTNIDEFFSAMESLLESLKMRQNIQVLRLFYENLEEELLQRQFSETFLPSLATRALEIETLFSAENPLIILKQHDAHPAVLTKRQISCILANMFFGTIDYSRYRSLIQWYDGPYRIETKIEKIKCLYNYFTRILAAADAHLNLKVIVQRLQYANKESISGLLPPLKPTIKIVQDKLIEDFLNPDGIHIDFANQCIGGGVLDTGRVQEEIMFVTSPELLISCQICECIEDKEAILIVGAERYSSYTGYSSTFAFKEDFVDPRGVDSVSQMKQTAVVAIDALFFHEQILSMQYQPKMILRELIKALTGFQVSALCPQEFKIITGNWGCGSFHGDAQLKFLIQWIACSISGRDLVYCTFQNESLKDIAKIVTLLKGQSTEKLIKLLKNYKDNMKELSVFGFILKVCAKQPQTQQQLQASITNNVSS